MPVVLRNGGRNFGGAMSWDTPKRLAAFDAQGVFGGLAIPEDILINTEFSAARVQSLNSKTLAKLIEHHWSPDCPSVQGAAFFSIPQRIRSGLTLPLSGLFVDMLSRLIRPGATGKRFRFSGY